MTEHFQKDYNVAVLERGHPSLGNVRGENMSEAIRPNREWQLARTESGRTTLFGVGAQYSAR